MLRKSLSGGFLVFSLSLTTIPSTSPSHLNRLYSLPHLAHLARTAVCYRRQPYSIFANMSPTTGPTPPVAPHDFASYTPERIKALIEKAIARNRELEDKITKLKPEECTFETVAKPLSLDDALFDTECNSGESLPGQ